MKTWQTVKKWLSNGCVYFTAIARLFILLKLITAGTDNAGGIKTISFLLMFPCGLCLSAAGMLTHMRSIPRWARTLLHYFITVLAIFLFLWLPSSSAASGSTLMLMLVLFTVLYWIFFGLIKLIKSRVRKLMEED